MRVERYNRPAEFDDVRALVLRLERMLLEGRYTLTSEIDDFERRLAAFLGARHVVGVNSGNDALILAFKALGIAPGERIVTQANTFNSTAAAIVWAGAEPVLVDVDEETFQMDPAALAAVDDQRVRCVCPVHLYGEPAPMDDVLVLAQQRGWSVVEDAAQAIGAKWRGRRVGTLGMLGCFSFHPSKNLAAAGDGGAIVCADEHQDVLLRRLRALGQRAQNEHLEIGLNSKLGSMQAVVLDSKLDRLEGWNAARRAVAAAYRERLADLPLRFQKSREQSEHVYHLFQVRTERRDALLAHLRANGIDAVVRYPVPIHRQPAFAHLPCARERFPVAERLADELLALPLRPDLSEAELDHVCASVRSFFERGAQR